MRVLFLSFLLWVPAIAMAAPEQYRTARGYVFERVELPGFGGGWKSPSGSIWSDCVGTFSNRGEQGSEEQEVRNSPATNQCEARRGKLPSVQEFKDLNFLFYQWRDGQPLTWNEQDIQDFLHLFPTCDRSRFGSYWTRNAMEDQTRFVNGFDPFGDLARPDELKSVRCIAH
jgi:hypothetical protein